MAGSGREQRGGGRSAGADPGFLSLDADGVLEMTDAGNTLHIRASDLARLALLGKWSLSGTDVRGADGGRYDLYTATTRGGETVRLYVDTEILAV